MTKLLTPQEVATRLSVTPRTAQRWMAAGEMPALQLPSGDYRVDPADLERWERERREIVRLVSPNVARVAKRH